MKRSLRPLKCEKEGSVYLIKLVTNENKGMHLFIKKRR